MSLSLEKLSSNDCDRESFSEQPTCWDRFLSVSSHAGKSVDPCWSYFLMAEVENVSITSPRFWNLSSMTVSTSTLKNVVSIFRSASSIGSSWDSEPKCLSVVLSHLSAQPLYSFHYTLHLQLSVRQKSQCSFRTWGPLWLSSASQLPHLAWRVTA